MSDHTPGPWVWQNGCSWWRLGHDHDGDVMRPEVMTDGWPTLSFPNGGPYGPDARLIAAAPDLLEALEDATRELIGERDCLYESVSLGDGTIPDPEDKAGIAEMDRVIDKARKALAKARGETMSNEDISQNPEKLRALALARGARIERLEVALSHARHALILWTDDPHGDLRDSAIEFADKALDDDGAGSVTTTDAPHSIGYVGNDIPPQHREALEALDAIVPELEFGRGTHVQWRDYLQQHPDGEKRNPECGDADFHAKMVEVYDKRLDAINKARRHLTAPPTVPEAVDVKKVRAVRDDITAWGERAWNNSAAAQATRWACELDRAIAQHSEPGLPVLPNPVRRMPDAMDKASDHMESKGDEAGAKVLRAWARRWRQVFDQYFSSSAPEPEGEAGCCSFCGRTSDEPCPPCDGTMKEDQPEWEDG